MSATVPALSIAGDVFGMQTTEVNPPRAAAAVPVAMVSLAVWPGSRRWTCRSIRPGQTTIPFGVEPFDVLRAPGAAFLPTAAIFPSRIEHVRGGIEMVGGINHPPAGEKQRIHAREDTRGELTRQARAL